jgi:hypothetical protein
MKQIVGNACGTVGILHSILNAKSHPLVQLTPGSYMETLLDKSSIMTPDELAVHIDGDDVFYNKC